MRSHFPTNPTNAITSLRDAARTLSCANALSKKPKGDRHPQTQQMRSHSQRNTQNA
ncbi:hypothetical protein [Nostoc sp.]|uniref:hypothetical protein n=1 Tax=Nostoc sp. TaxID=1180 RepID=UPI002FFAF028